MKKITATIILITILFCLTSCRNFEFPEGEIYQCDNPYMYLYFNTQEKTSYMEYKGKIIKVMPTLNIGGNFFIQEYEGALYVPDSNKVLNLTGGEMIVSGTAITDNENDALYLLPDTKEYPEFTEVFELYKVE